MPQARKNAPRRALVPVAPYPYGAAAILPEAADVRFLDGLVTIAVAALTVLWTASRQPGPAVAWALFWMLLGLVMAVEGRGALRYGGFGVAAANAAYLALRVTQQVSIAQAQVARQAADIALRYVA